MAGFIYPRTVSISRVTIASAVGDRGYGGARGSSNESVLFSGIDASIQANGAGVRSPAGLPSDPKVQPQWKILLNPGAAIAPGVIKHGDIVTDETGARYQVWQAAFTSLGWNLTATSPEA